MQEDGRWVILLLHVKKYLPKIQRGLEIFLYSLLSYISFMGLTFEILFVMALLKEHENLHDCTSGL